MNYCVSKNDFLNHSIAYVNERSTIKANISKSYVNERSTIKANISKTVRDTKVTCSTF